ncbi:MAG: hypothetical protein SGCHY_003487 [Lobulomycetales sp.]
MAETPVSPDSIDYHAIQKVLESTEIEKVSPRRVRGGIRSVMAEAALKFSRKNPLAAFRIDEALKTNEEAISKISKAAQTPAVERYLRQLLQNPKSVLSKSVSPQARKSLLIAAENPPKALEKRQEQFPAAFSPIWLSLMVCPTLNPTNAMQVIYLQGGEISPFLYYSLTLPLVIVFDLFRLVFFQIPNAIKRCFSRGRYSHKDVVYDLIT